MRGKIKDCKIIKAYLIRTTEFFAYYMLIEKQEFL